MRRRQGETAPLVYRTVSAVVFGVAGLLIAAWFILDALRALDQRGARVGIAATLVAAALIVAVQIRPAIIADEAGVLIRNPFRTIRVPWSLITGFGVQYSLNVHTAERTFSAWAVSRSSWRRPGGPASPLPDPPGGQPRAPSFADQAVQELTMRLTAYRQSPVAARTEDAAAPAEVRATWSRPMLAAFAAAVALLVLTLTIG